MKPAGREEAGWLKGSDDGNWKLNTGNREKGTGWKSRERESGTRRRWPTRATERERVAILDRVNEGMVQSGAKDGRARGMETVAEADG